MFQSSSTDPNYLQCSVFSQTHLADADPALLLHGKYLVCYVVTNGIDGVFMGVAIGHGGFKYKDRIPLALLIS